MKNLAISTTFTSDNSSLREALELCRSIDIEFIELGSNHKYEKNYDYIREYSYKYLVHNYFPIPENSFVVNIASLNSAIRSKSIAHLKNAIDFCNDSGAHLYTFHPGFLTDPDGASLNSSNYDFLWNDNHLNQDSYAKAINNFYRSLDIIIPYAQSAGVCIAIESEGSISKKDHLIMQNPEEYLRLMELYSPEEIKVNLNVGHLNLASKAYSFSRFEFVENIYHYLVAIEFSHNDRKTDQHLPIKFDQWYIDLMMSDKYLNIYKILEYRNTDIKIIKKNVQMIRKKYNEFQISQ